MPVIISSNEDTASTFFKGRAVGPRARHNYGMANSAWRVRLQAALETSGKSKRSVSLASGNGPGYIHSILSEGKEPTVENLLAVCEAIPVDPAWIIHGIDATPGDMEILRAMRRDPQARAAILSLLRSFAR